jgi:hypothetical protein
LQAGVQLANRTGPLNEIEYSEFVMKAQAFADALGGTPDFPDMLQEVARARELDQFASQHDAQLGFTAACAPAPPGARVTCSSRPRAWALWPAPCPAAWCCRRPTPGHAAGAGPGLRHRRPRWPKTRRRRPCARWR